MSHPRRTCHPPAHSIGTVCSIGSCITVVLEWLYLGSGKLALKRTSSCDVGSRLWQKGACTTRALHNGTPCQYRVWFHVMTTSIGILGSRDSVVSVSPEYLQGSSGGLHCANRLLKGVVLSYLRAGLTFSVSWLRHEPQVHETIRLYSGSECNVPKFGTS